MTGAWSWETAAILESLRAEYALDGPVLGRRLRKPDGGIRLWLRDKAGGYLLKDRPDYIAVDDYPLEIELHHAASKAGAPVPELVPTRSGRLWTQLQDREVSLQRLIEGRVARLDTADAGLLGAAVRAFATAMKEVRGPLAGDWSFPRGRVQWLPDTPSALRGCFRFFAETAGIPAEVLQPLGDAVERAWRGCPSELPASFIHGDVSPLNCVVCGAQAYLTDLDEMRWGLPLFDLLQGFVTVAALTGGPHGMSLRAEWGFEEGAAYLDAAMRERQLEPAEARAARPFSHLVLVRVAAGELDLDDPRYPARPDVAEQVTKLCRLLRSPSPLDRWLARQSLGRPGST